MCASYKEFAARLGLGGESAMRTDECANTNSNCFATQRHSWMSTQTHKRQPEKHWQCVGRMTRLESCPITELIANISDPIILLNPRRPFPRPLTHSLRCPRSLTFHLRNFFSLSSLSSPFWWLNKIFYRIARAAEKKRRRKNHKMIITTTIWWLHNWLNIKNCSEISGSIEMWNQGEGDEWDVLLCKQGEEKRIMDESRTQ